MKPLMPSLFPVASIAALSAILGLVGCQYPDSSITPSAPTEIPEAPPAKAAAVNPGDEIIISTVCNVAFNSSQSLGSIPDQAHNGHADQNGYTETCRGGSVILRPYKVIVRPINTTKMNLIPEASNWCTGSRPRIGTRMGAMSCVNQTEGKYWPRKAGNIGGNSGVEIFREGGVALNLRSIDILSDRGVEVELETPGADIQRMTLARGTTQFAPGTSITRMKIFGLNNEGSFLFDNLKVSRYP